MLSSLSIFLLVPFIFIHLFRLFIFQDSNNKKNPEKKNDSSIFLYIFSHNLCVIWLSSKWNILTLWKFYFHTMSKHFFIFFSYVIIFYSIQFCFLFIIVAFIYFFFLFFFFLSCCFSLIITFSFAYRIARVEWRCW